MRKSERTLGITRMRRFLEIIAISALLIYIVSAVLNQSTIWSYWRYVVLSFWEFALFMGAFHYYSTSRFKVWYFVLIGAGLVGFSAINAFHAAYSLAVWFGSDLLIQQCLDSVLDEYNFFFMLMAGCFAIVCALIYLVNLPDILHRDKQ